MQWAHGFDIKFGLFAWELGMGSRREIRAATPLLAGIYKELPAQVSTFISPWPHRAPICTDCAQCCAYECASMNSHEAHRLSARAMPGGTCPGHLALDVTTRHAWDNPSPLAERWSGRFHPLKERM